MTPRRLLPLLAALAAALVLPTIGGASPSATYRVWTIAGTGAACTSTPASACEGGGLALAAQLTPTRVALAPDGSIVVASGRQIYRLGRDGRIVRIAGSGDACTTATCGDGGPALAAQVAPNALVVGADGTIFVGDNVARTIRAISPAGTITRLAGAGGTCTPPACGDGGRAREATFTNPVGLAIDDRHGLLYVVDALAGAGGQVRVIDLTGGTVQLVAGSSGTIPAGCPGSCGDGGAATAATLIAPIRVAVDDAANVYVGELGDVRRIHLGSGIITRYAGTGVACNPGACGATFGDGGPALSAPVTYAIGVVATADGIVFGDINGSLRRVDAGGTVHLIAGAGICATAPSCGDGGPALAATFGEIDSMASDGRGGFVVADRIARRVRWITQGLPPPVTVGLQAFAVTPAAPRHGQALTVSVALTHAARLTLTVRSGTHRFVVRTLAGKVGVSALRWNGKLGSTFAKAGRYTLVVTATSGTVTATSSLVVRLR